MESRKRWIAGTLLALPIAGLVAATAIPRPDGFETLDRMGTRVDPFRFDEERLPASMPASERAKARAATLALLETYRQDEARRGVRTYSWKIHWPEEKARKTIDQVFLFELGWQWSGRSTGRYGRDDGTPVVTHDTTYTDLETGDVIEVIKETSGTPGVTLLVNATHSTRPRTPYAKLERWARQPLHW